MTRTGVAELMAVAREPEGRRSKGTEIEGSARAFHVPELGGESEYWEIRIKSHVGWRSRDPFTRSDVYDAFILIHRLTRQEMRVTLRMNSRLAREVATHGLMPWVMMCDARERKIPVRVRPLQGGDQVVILKRIEIDLLDTWGT